MNNDNIDKFKCSEIFTIGFVKHLLRGSGQVMFQNNAVTGLFFIAGIFWGSYETGNFCVAWGAVIGLIVSTLTGYILGLPKTEGEIGLWGFNGILVGCAIFTFLGSTMFSWLALILCSAMTTWVRVGLNNILAPYSINSLTFPFVTSTWIFLLASRAMEELPITHLASPLLPGFYDSNVHMGISYFLVYWLKGISQVFLIDSWITGIIFIIGLFVCNYRSAIWAMAASAISLFVAITFRAVGVDIESGLFGFSAVLTGIALGSTFYKTNWKTGIWCIIGIIVTVFIQAATDILFEPLGIPTLTAPFCFATWMFLLPLFKFEVINKSKVSEE